MIKNKKLFYGILIIIILIIVGTSLFLINNLIVMSPIKEMIPEEERGYYGFSTFNQCQNNNDCFVSGCNSEICQSRFEETRFSICILPDRSTPSQLGYGCGCHLNKCQWIK
jgi:eight-cysteine-cluster-containing protein